MRNKSLGKNIIENASAKRTVARRIIRNMILHPPATTRAPQPRRGLA